MAKVTVVFLRISCPDSDSVSRRPCAGATKIISVGSLFGGSQERDAAETSGGGAKLG